MVDTGRSHRIGTTGNLQRSMRANYDEYGVDSYYKKVGATYRNPHLPGVCACMFTWLDRWWKHEQSALGSRTLLIFDMACGSGEVTLAAYQWWKGANSKPVRRGPLSDQAPPDQPTSTSLQCPRTGIASYPDTTSYPFDMRIMAADPYTAEAYLERTTLPCAPLSFMDIAGGALPSTISHLTSLGKGSDSSAETSALGNNVGDAVDKPIIIDMVVCSFALHLVQSPSELFSLLWELSTKARWLVVLAPHKKPQIKDGWGWVKWDCDSWDECPMADRKGEDVQDRVHSRVYRSVNFSQQYIRDAKQ
ncbi:hypothetical protein SCLCIDRAFT_1224588 [Scleroderma citrinum Foug A]|uniref:Uncharacterized protein n=1 Tax=Scleroderma citrinum Foug A TaxID=1036808 RepID=A0A0C3D4M1_9AGAM|nr:hypothetical protein SCLCIDRAFT_1224588 [Scleroderma citrinum Foug A]